MLRLLCFAYSMIQQPKMAPPSGTQRQRHLPQAALVLVDWGEAVSVDGVEVILVGDPWGDDFRVHNEALPTGAGLMQRLQARRGRGGGGGRMREGGGWLAACKRVNLHVAGREPTAVPLIDGRVHGSKLKKPAAALWQGLLGDSTAH